MADFTFKDGDLYVNGEHVGPVSSMGLTVSLPEGTYTVCVQRRELEWPDVVLEDVLDAEFIGD